MSMSWDPTARRHHRLSLLLVLVLLSRAGALRPVELFPYGELWGDRLPQEGDVESSPAVKLAVPLCFYSDQFSNLYPSPHSWLTATRVTAVAGSCMEDTSWDVLSLAACYLCTGFPLTRSSFPPTHFFLATWEQVGA
eukprot:XP_017446766.1 PREDICTED: nidogen-2-like [Rattus norvegicus]